MTDDDQEERLRRTVRHWPLRNIPTYEVLGETLENLEAAVSRETTQLSVFFFALGLVIATALSLVLAVSTATADAPLPVLVLGTHGAVLVGAAFQTVSSGLTYRREHRLRLTIVARLVGASKAGTDGPSAA